MINARETVCWGALPRRQPRLQRSSYSALGVIAVLAPTLSIAAVVVVCLGFAPLS